MFLCTYACANTKADPYMCAGLHKCRSYIQSAFPPLINHPQHRAVRNCVSDLEWNFSVLPLCWKRDGEGTDQVKFWCSRVLCGPISFLTKVQLLEQAPLWMAKVQGRITWQATLHRTVLNERSWAGSDDLVQVKQLLIPCHAHINFILLISRINQHGQMLHQYSYVAFHTSHLNRFSLLQRWRMSTRQVHIINPIYCKFFNQF